MRSRGAWARSRSWVVVVAMMAVVGAAATEAQSGKGALRGHVKDAQGVIPGAEVTLVNQESNAVCSAMSNAVGEYVFASVLRGTYTVRVSLPGFRMEERKGLHIATQQAIVQDFMLEAGAISEQVTVTGGAPPVERATTTVASTPDEATLEALPIVGRSTFSASGATPGVIRSAATRISCAPRTSRTSD